MLRAQKSKASSKMTKSTTKITSKKAIKKTPLKTQSKRTMSNKKLTVILAQDFEELGKAGDLVAIKPGRARNHLIPKGIASYDTKENRQELRAKGVDVKDVVIDLEAELKAASTRSYPTVQGDIVRNIRWEFFREPVTSADNHVKKPVTKREILTKLRLSQFHFVQETDIEFPAGYDNLNHCGAWPCAVLLHGPDVSEYQTFTVNVNRYENKSKQEEEDAAAV